MYGLLHEACLEAVARVTEEATDGPWSVGLEQDGVMAGYPTVVRAGSKGLRIVNVDDTRPFLRGDDYRDAVANVAFIAAARDAVPNLLAENRRLRALLSLNDLEQLDGTE